MCFCSNIIDIYFIYYLSFDYFVYKISEFRLVFWSSVFLCISCNPLQFTFLPKNLISTKTAFGIIATFFVILGTLSDILGMTFFISKSVAVQLKCG